MLWACVLPPANQKQTRYQRPLLHTRAFTHNSVHNCQGAQEPRKLKGRECQLVCGLDLYPHPRKGGYHRNQVSPRGPVSSLSLPLMGCALFKKLLPLSGPVSLLVLTRSLSRLATFPHRPRQRGLTLRTSKRRNRAFLCLHCH